MGVKLRVFIARALISILSLLQAPDIRFIGSLNPFNWSFQFGFFYLLNQYNGGRMIHLVFPFGKIYIEYADADVIAHNLQHQICDRIEANLLKEGETLESAGYGAIIPQNCGAFG